MILSSNVRIFKVLATMQKARLTSKRAVIDYVEDLNSSGFNIENPNTPTWDNPKSAGDSKTY